MLDDLSTGDAAADRRRRPLVVGLDAGRATGLTRDARASTRSRGRAPGGEEAGGRVGRPSRCSTTGRTSRACASCWRRSPRPGVESFVFSSSAAVYGDAGRRPGRPRTPPCVPISPYGETKLVGEWLVARRATRHGLRTACLRYFNVAGAATPELADTRRLQPRPDGLRAADRAAAAADLRRRLPDPGRHLRPRLHPRRRPRRGPRGGGPRPGRRRRARPDRSTSAAARASRSAR